MIKIQVSGNSGLVSSDRSYNLPNFTGAVQWNGGTKCLEVSSGGSWQRIENTVELSLYTPYDPMIIGTWVMKKIAEEEETKKLRSKYPALDEAYNHLDLIKALVTSGPENDIQQS